MSHHDKDLKPSELFARSKLPEKAAHNLGDADHVAQCSECAEILKLSSTFTMPSELNQEDSSGKECISEDVIYSLAADLQPTDIAIKITEHISTCSRCSPLLKQALEDLNAEEPLASNFPPLQSSTEAWQQNLAERMANERSVAEFPHIAKRRASVGRTWRLIGSIAATLIVTTTIGYLYWSSNTVERLLATSYNAQRLTDLRVRGGKPVPMYSPRLGESSDSQLPSQLLEAKLEVKKHLEKSPEDGYWHQIRGQIALLENQGKAASEDFEFAHNVDPSLPGLDLDRAAAHYEWGKAENDPSQYGKASDLYGEFIDNSANSPRKDLLSIAYFNRALVLEAQGLPDLALKDYQSALAIENSIPWRREIQEQIDRLTATRRKSGRTMTPTVLPTAADFLVAYEANAADRPGAYEVYLTSSVRNWIAQRGQSLTVDQALHKLAQIGQRHKDSWLRDLLALPRNTKVQDADRYLAAAVTANSAGDPNRGILKAESASALYRKAGNQPGLMRAQAETVYSLQRLGRSEECISRALPLLKAPQIGKYSWLHGYLLLEQASCEGARGDLTLSALPIRQSLVISESAHLLLEQLRAQSFLADQLNMLGENRDAWQVSIAGLEACAGVDGTEMRTYQFLSNMYFAAKAEHLPWAAAGLAEATAHAAEALENRQIQAYAQEELGTAETEIHHFQAATAAFDAATHSMQSITNGSARSLYEADWTSDRAALQEESGNLQAALQLLANVGPSVNASDNHLARQRYFTEFAHLLLKAHRPIEAEAQALRAVADAERSFPELHNPIEKLTWERDNSRGYRILVQSLIDMGRPELSLRAWEWYRSCAYRASWISADENPIRMKLPPFPEIPQVPDDQITLVYARLEDRLVAWSIIGREAPKVRFASLNVTPVTLTSLTETHARLIRDPASSVAAIANIGTTIFSSLMPPFEDQIEHVGTIRIDIDNSIATISLSAICDSNRTWLGANHGLLILPPWWSVHELLSQDLVPPKSALVVAGNPMIDGNNATTRIPEQYEESREVAAKFHKAQLIRYPNVEAPSLLTLLASAHVFHYTGHAIERNGVTGLVLNSQDNLLTAASFAPGSLHHCELAVLAGCTTKGRSLYEAEDPRSLVNALLIAGASKVIATQWDVDARCSRLLMLRFYDAFLAGNPPPEALRIARNALLLSPSSSHPYFWAAYQAYSG